MAGNGRSRVVEVRLPSPQRSEERARRTDHEPHLPDEAEPVLSPGSERGGAPRRSRREQPGRTTGDGPSRPTEEDWRALAPPNRGSPRSEAQQASPSFGGTQADPRERSDRASAQGRQRKRQRNIHTSHTHERPPSGGASVCGRAINRFGPRKAMGSGCEMCLSSADKLPRPAVGKWSLLPAFGLSGTDVPENEPSLKATRPSALQGGV